MDISKSEVKRITELSSIACSDDELSSYMKDLSKIIELFDKLKYVNTDNIEPFNYLALINIQRNPVESVRPVLDERAKASLIDAADGKNRQGNKCCCFLQDIKAEWRGVLQL